MPLCKANPYGRAPACTDEPPSLHWVICHAARALAKCNAHKQISCGFEGHITHVRRHHYTYITPVEEAPHTYNRPLPQHKDVVRFFELVGEHIPHCIFLDMKGEHFRKQNIHSYKHYVF
jgi:hypothetical protein